MNPTLAAAHSGLADLLTCLLGDHWGAKVHYMAALKADPTDAALHQSLGMLLTKSLQDHDGAKLHYEAALQIDPDSASAHESMACLLKQHYGDYEGAKLHFGVALQVDSKCASAHEGMARLLWEHYGDHEGAKRHYETALQINPEFVAAHDGLADLFANHFCNYTDAKYHYEFALQFNPCSCAWTHQRLATLLENRFRDYKGARRHYEVALQLDPNFGEAHEHMAHVLAAHLCHVEEWHSSVARTYPQSTAAHDGPNNFLVDLEGAKQHYEAAIRIDPDFAEAHDSNRFFIVQPCAFVVPKVASSRATLGTTKAQGCTMKKRFESTQAVRGLTTAWQISSRTTSGMSKGLSCTALLA